MGIIPTEPGKIWRPPGESSCGSDTSTYYFGRQSGLANGVDAVVYTPPEEPTDYGVLEEFVLGKCAM